MEYGTCIRRWVVWPKKPCAVFIAVDIAKVLHSLAYIVFIMEYNSKHCQGVTQFVLHSVHNAKWDMYQAGREVKMTGTPCTLHTLK